MSGHSTEFPEDALAKATGLPESTQLPTLAPAAVPFPVRRFTVGEYQEMVRAGILGEDDQVELLEGWITPRISPHSPPS